MKVLQDLEEKALSGLGVGKCWTPAPAMGSGVYRTTRVAIPGSGPPTELLLLSMSRPVTAVPAPQHLGSWEETLKPAQKGPALHDLVRQQRRAEWRGAEPPPSHFHIYREDAQWAEPLSHPDRGAGSRKWAAVSNPQRWP